MLTSEQIKSLDIICCNWPEQKPTITPSRLKWFSTNHEIVFNKLLHRRTDGVYLELGSWTGAGSTEHVTKTFKNMSLICVDTFEGSPENHKDSKQKVIANNLWQHFCCNRWDERDRIWPMKGKTIECMTALAQHKVFPDFVYIDAAHDVESVFADLQTALNLFPNAIILGDDYTAPNQDHCQVYLAIDRAIKQGLIKSTEFKNVGRAWYLTRNLS